MAILALFSIHLKTKDRSSKTSLPFSSFRFQIYFLWLSKLQPWRKTCLSISESLSIPPALPTAAVAANTVNVLQRVFRAGRGPEVGEPIPPLPVWHYIIKLGHQLNSSFLRMRSGGDRLQVRN